MQERVRLLSQRRGAARRSGAGGRLLIADRSLRLSPGLREYAVIAAFHDSRFSPIAVSELAHLRCDISLLTQFEKITGAGAAGVGSNGSSSANGYSSSHLPLHDWTIGRHGVTIEFSCPVTSRRYNATFLPEVAAEQGWSHAQTLEELIHKSGFRGAVNMALHERIALTRYQSEKESLTFDDYCDMRHQITGVPHRPHQTQPQQHSHALKHKAAASGGAGSGARPLVHVDSDSDSDEEEEEEEEPDDEDSDADDDGAALSAAELAAAAHHASKKAKLAAAAASNGHSGAVAANGLRK